MLKKLDTCLLVITLCAARWVSSGMRIDTVEVPRALADTEKMVKCILFESNDKIWFYHKIRKRIDVFCDCTINYCTLYCFILC